MILFAPNKIVSLYFIHSNEPSPFSLVITEWLLLIYSNFSNFWEIFHVLPTCTSLHFFYRDSGIDKWYDFLKSILSYLLLHYLPLILSFNHLHSCVNLSLRGTGAQTLFYKYLTSYKLKLASKICFVSSNWICCQWFPACIFDKYALNTDAVLCHSYILDAAFLSTRLRKKFYITDDYDHK